MKYSEFFMKVFERTIGHEGKFQKDPRDRGNWTGGEVGKGTLKGTKFGISAMTYPNLDIENLTLDDALQLYYNDWWLKFGMERWHKALAYQMFDAAFNHGTGRANQFLQRAAGVKDDGIIGNTTISKVAEFDINDLLFRFLAERLEYFTNVKTWAEYSRGWSRRVAQMMRYAAEDN